MDALRNIVVGLDLTPGSRGAFAQASRIASRNDATLHALHAIEPTLVDEVRAFVGLGSSPTWDEIRSRGREMVQRFAEGVDGSSTSMTQGRAAGVVVDVEVGTPLDALKSAVRAHEADLLVVGLRTSENRLGPGPVATGCLRHVPTTVLLAREDHTGPYASVIACTDFSAASVEAVRMAARMARLDEAALRIVHVTPPPSLALDYSGDPLGPWSIPPMELSAAWDAYRASLRLRLVRFVEPLAAEMSQVSYTLDIVENRHYGRGIAAYAKKHNADLLVMGSQGRTSLGYALLGSTVERVLAALPCSALAIKSAEVRNGLAASIPQEHAAGRWEV